MNVRRRRDAPERPATVFDAGLQHERTSLAWERTAISTMVAGVLLGRFAAIESVWLLAAGGIVQVVFGSALLVWSGIHYDDLHGQLRRGSDVVHPYAVRWVGRATIVGSGAGLVAAVVVVTR